MSTFREPCNPLYQDEEQPDTELFLRAVPFYIMLFYIMLYAVCWSCLPRTIDELKAAIRQEITGISPQITARVMETFRNQLRMCIEKNGRHLDSVIFKTQ
ncbi:hypothetical protein ALC56_04099 [Trachymyrmex septentrionalis]|uniref:Uncharacterized protein n=1 Tax=Trachymyrmex septentrionalis TaxID=34720 RepID=A0A151JYG0_9HYME|nr:hypothetical protein ALC56_04099 [Trachymyrmex septentrionalis]